MLLKDINTNDKKFFEYSSVPLIGGDVCAYRIVLNTEFDLTGCRAVINAKRSDGRVFSDAGEVNKNLAVYIINSSMYSVAGEVSIRLSVISNDGSTVTDKELVFEAVEEFGLGDMCTEDGKSIADVFTAHMENTSNPHHVTADQLGLGDVPDNIKSLEKNKLSYTIADSLPGNAYLGINCAYFIKYTKSDYDAVDNPNAVGYRMYMGIKNNNTYVWSMIGEVDNGSIITAKIADSAVTGNKIASYAVTNTKIASGAVNTDKIYDKSVTSAKLADAGVTSAKIASGAVTSAKIASGAVTEEKITSGAVTAGKIASGAVTSEKIADGAVTGGKIADKTITNNNMARNSISVENLTSDLWKNVLEGAACHRPYYMSERHYSFYSENEVNRIFYIFNDMDSASSHIYAGDDYGWDIYQETDDGNLVPFSIAPGEIRGAYVYSEYIPGVDGKNGMLFVTKKVRGIHGLMIEDESITSSKISSHSINEYLLANNSVLSEKISDNAVTSGKIEDGAVTSAKIASGAVSGGKIADNAVTSAKIASNSVTSAKIASGAVTEGKIASNSVTSAKIASDAVTEEKITSGAVTEGKIASGAVTSAKIADGAVTRAKLSSLAVNKNDLSQDIQKILEDGPEKYRPYYMSGYQQFNDIEDFKDFYLCNDMDYATSYIYAADDYGWKIYYEDDGNLTKLNIKPGEIYRVYIYTRFVSGADCSDGKIFAQKKVANLNAVVLENGSITTDKLDDYSITSNKIKSQAIGMEHLSPELQQLLAKIK